MNADMLNVINRSVKMFSFLLDFLLATLIGDFHYYVFLCIIWSAVYILCFSYQLLYSSALFFFFFFFFPVQLALLLLILVNLYLVLYIPLFFGCFVRGCLTVFQWRPVLLSSHFSQFSSAAQPCPTLCNPMTTACQASQSITNSQSLLRFVSTESVMTPNHLILSYQSPPAFNPSQHQGVFK